MMMIVLFIDLYFCLFLYIARVIVFLLFSVS